MAAVTSLASGYTGTDASVFTSASIAPVPQQVILVAIGATRSGTTDPPTPLVFGAGLKWVLAGGGTIHRGSDYTAAWFFRAMATGFKSGTLTFDFQGVTMMNCAHSVFTVDEVRTGLNGKNAIVRVLLKDDGVSGTSIAIPFGDYANDENLAVVWGFHAANEAVAAAGGTTLIHSLNGTAPAQGWGSAWGEEIASPALSWTTGANNGAIAVELLAYQHDAARRRRPEKALVRRVPVRVRHIVEGDGAGAYPVLGRDFVPDWIGPNGRQGYIDGSYEDRMSDEGQFSLTFPNSYGDDGRLHRERFDVITKGKRVPGVTDGSVTYSGGSYRPGDEWIEIYEGSAPAADLVCVGTPVAAEITATTITIRGWTAPWLLRKSRETAVGFWHHAPRDVIEHYSSIWQALYADHFPGNVVFTYLTTEQTSGDGKWKYTRCFSPGMAFPATSVLDTFDRANEGPPPSAEWVALGSTPGLEVVSNQMAVDSGGVLNGSKWNTSMDADSEIFVTLSTLSDGDIVELHLRHANDPPLEASYFVRYTRQSGNDTFTLYRRRSGLDTSLAAADATQNWANGDAIGFDAITDSTTGDVYLGVYKRVSGSTSWSKVKSVTDSSDPLPQAGYLAVYMTAGTGSRLDDFGGGSKVRQGTVRLYPGAASTTATMKGTTPFESGWTPFTEHFEGDQLDGYRWTQGSFIGASARVQDGLLEIVVDNSAADMYGGISTRNGVDFRDRFAWTEILDWGTQLPNSEMGMTIGFDADNGLAWTIGNNGAFAYKNVAGGGWTLVDSLPGGTPLPRFIGIRESGGNTSWEYSNDGLNWTILETVANPIALSANIHCDLWGGHFVADGANRFAFRQFQLAGGEGHPAWRMEVSYARSALFGTADSLRVGVMDFSTGTEIAYASVGSAPGTPIDVGVDGDPPGPFRIAVEGHGRYIYFYARGRLLGHMPAVDRPIIPFVTFARGSSTFTGVQGGEAWVDVDFCILRRTRPLLTRGPERGDYHLPLGPDRHRQDDGLVATYYDDHDLQVEVSDSDWTDRVLAPVRTPYARRLEAAPAGAADLAGVTNWQPVGPAKGEFFSVRWKGSVYLDLARFDYTFRVLSDDRVRLYVARTRIGEEQINDWTVAGHAPSIKLAHGAVKGTFGFDPTAGWYPFILESSSGGGYGMCVCQVNRDDYPNLWMSAGEGSYPLLVAASGPSSFWRLNDYLGSDGNACSDHIGALAGTYRGSGTTIYRTGWLSPPLNAPDFDGTTDYVEFGDQYDFTGTAPFSVEAWVIPDVYDSTSRHVVSKLENVAAGSSDGWRLYYNSTDGVAFGRYVAGTENRVTSGAANMVAGRWFHLVGVYDGANIHLYVNGVKYGPTADARSLAGHTDQLYIGRSPATFSATGFVDGGISDVSVYSRILTAAEILDHYNARSTFGGAVSFSPFGIYESQVRYESHLDLLRSIADTYGYQWACSPRSLESGYFPGQLVPKIRVGRDTERVLDEFEASQYQLSISAEETVDALLADGSGIADPTQGVQLTAEAMNFEELGQHLALAEDYVSLGEINFEHLFLQRLESLLILRGSAWEQVQARPQGTAAELLDSFPLEGQLALFRWSVGDGVRLQIRDIGVHDLLPRQILGLTNRFVPEGKTEVSASFRQRPRNLIEMWRQLQRTQLRHLRNYQGQLVVASGTQGASGATDPYTRAVLPLSLSQVVQAWFVVTVKSDSSTWNVEINGTNRFTVTQTGRFDVRAYVASASTTDKVMKARVTGGTGTVEYHLELVVSI